MDSTKTEVISTNIVNLDRLMGGGIQAGSFLIVAGGPGTGKTILLQQLAFAIAKSPKVQTEFTQAPPSKGADVLFFSTLSEPHDKLLRHINQFSFYDEQLLAAQIRLLSLTTDMEKGLNKISELIVSEARHQSPRLVIIDSLGVLEDLQTTSTEFKWFLYRLSSVLGLLGITLVVSLERNLDLTGYTEGLTIADGIINLSSHIEGVQLVRRIEVKKLRGMNIVEGLHTYQISGDGLTFFPRLEALVQVQPRVELKPSDSVTTGSLKTTGLAELDQLAGGGFPLASSTVVAGAPGTGKTLLGLKYLLEGARQGEPGLLVGFNETAEQLIAKAGRLGMDLQNWVDQGLIQFLCLNPVELNPDLYTYKMRQIIEGTNIQRLVIDCLLELDRACQTPRRSHHFFMALLRYLKAQRVTTLYTYEISKLAGKELDLVGTAFSSLAENLLLLKQIEYQRRFYRYLAVLKMRENKFDGTIREFTIEDQAGLTVLKVDQSFNGLLDELTTI
jgi:circadian clock protein KaiC